mmetsp:Transcript_40340/g.29051  ORF Transcript_40340/g.29051 Transcript_40340/m.29051 type:complete len:148 (+) Transcript_40340:11-454(+)
MTFVFDRDFFFVLRHAEDASRRPDLHLDYTSHYDPCLTPDGVDQAKDSARFLQGFLENSGGVFNDILIYSSPFLSCIQTSLELMKSLKVKQLHIDARLSPTLATFYFYTNPLNDLSWHTMEEQDFKAKYAVQENAIIFDNYEDWKDI